VEREKIASVPGPIDFTSLVCCAKRAPNGVLEGEQPLPISGDS